MAYISSEILGLRNWFFKYCIIKKLLGCMVVQKTMGQICIWHYLSCLIGGEWKILFVDK